jgi:hypothetical protein
MSLERWRKWKLKAIWVEKTMSLNCGVFFFWVYVVLDMIPKLSSSNFLIKIFNAKQSTYIFNDVSQFETMILCPMYVRKIVFLYNMECVGKKHAHYFFLCVFSLLRFSHSLSSFKRPCFTIILCLQVAHLSYHKAST